MRIISGAGNISQWQSTCLICERPWVQSLAINSNSDEDDDDIFEECIIKDIPDRKLSFTISSHLPVTIDFTHLMLSPASWFYFNDAKSRKPSQYNPNG